MKRQLLGLALSALVPTAIAAADRETELSRLLRHDCGSCHGMRLAGGLGPALTPERLAGYPEDYIVRTILDGRPGTAMPPWRQLLNADDARWLAQTLKHGEPE